MDIPANGGGVPPPSLTKHQEEFVRQCVDVIIDLAVLYGFDSRGYARLPSYGHWIYCAAVMGDPMKFVKWKISSYFAFHHGQEVQPSVVSELKMDNPGVILGGRAYSYFNKVVKRTDPELFKSWLMSVLRSKGGMPRPNQEQLRDAEKAAFYKMTTKPVLPTHLSITSWADLSDQVSDKAEPVMITKQVIWDEIKRTVHELFDDYGDRSLKIKPFFPSTSANYNNSRSLGGAVGHILDHPELLRGLKTEEVLVQLKGAQTIDEKNGVVLVNDEALNERFDKFFRRLEYEAIVEQPLVVPLALAEALKTRVISKGPPLRYTALKPFQRDTWSHMKKHPAFTLIGQPVTPEHIQSRIGKTLSEDESFASLDYRDATNELYSWATNAAIEGFGEIPGYLTLIERELLPGALTEHVVVNPEDKLDIRTQKNSQLMGSIASFPFLCIINAAVVRKSYELGKKSTRIPLKNVPMTVNGDDCAVKFTQKSFTIWKKLAAFVGLFPSVGKVYFSRKFVNMNSENFEYYPEGWEGVLGKTRPDGRLIPYINYFRPQAYVNLGLLYGMKRSEGVAKDVASEPEFTLGPVARQLIAFAPVSLQRIVLKKFIHIHGKALKSFNLPWFIPEAFGGIGLPSVGDYCPRDIDLRLARKIHDHSEFKLPSKPTNSLWQTWKLANQLFDERAPTDLSSHSFVNNFYEYSGSYTTPSFTSVTRDDVVSKICVELLFQGHGIEKLFLKPGPTMASNYFRSVSRMWKKALLDTKYPLPEPFNPARYPVAVYSLPHILHVHV